MHKLLQRQLKRVAGMEALQGAPEPWRSLLAAVSEAYEQSDADRQLLERSLEISSQELMQANAELRAVFRVLSQLNHAFLNLGPDFTTNIDTLTQACGELLGATCAVYSRLEDGVLLAVGRWHAPPDYPAAMKAEGHPCYDVIAQGHGGVTVVRNLPQTPYATPDSPVTRYHLKTYVGHPVFCFERAMGSICAVYDHDLELDDHGKQVLQIVATALGIEEDRRRSAEALAERAKELARSNAELEQFAYVASHDLQEPLRMVASYVQLLARRYQGKLDADADEFIQYAVQGASRMREMINDLLAYSRVGTRGKPFERTEVSSVLDQVLMNLKLSIEETRAVITHNGLPTVVCDPTQLGQLFQNLLGNALKFRGHEPPKIDITVVRRGREWVFSVKDHGIGFDPQYAERVFLLFQRLHTHAEYPGTGLGLAICKKIVERHGGHIWVETAVGKGATFCFTLPEASDAQEGGEPS